uniref:Uncharacterized protein n=1 Tax=Piliocolobus tephrosceles TaxID=591936 RepID=A0A8C9GWX3_9PRIM
MKGKHRMERPSSSSVWSRNVAAQLSNPLSCSGGPHPAAFLTSHTVCFTGLCYPLGTSWPLLTQANGTKGLPRPFPKHQGSLCGKIKHNFCLTIGLL